jgi:hypothetical protein
MIIIFFFGRIENTTEVLAEKDIGGTGGSAVFCGKRS